MLCGPSSKAMARAFLSVVLTKLTMKRATYTVLETALLSVDIKPQIYNILMSNIKRCAKYTTFVDKKGLGSILLVLLDATLS